MRNYITLALLIILFGFTSSPYDSISKFDWNGNAWALVQQDGLYGFIDVFGEEKILLFVQTINGKEYKIKKLSTENKELYGSVKPTEISKLIQEDAKLDIKPSMIQPINEIKSIGKFKVKIILHSEIDSEITIDVVTADTIQ